MRKLKVPLAISAALLVAVILGGTFAKPVWAQVRAALVRDTDNPALAPFSAGVNFTLGAVNDQRLLTTVPAGRRLVIEYISFETSGPTSDQMVFGALRIGQFGPLAVHLQINPPHASVSSSFFIQDGSQPVKAYFEAGQEVWVSVSDNTGAPNRNFEMHVVGNYVTP